MTEKVEFRNWGTRQIELLTRLVRPAKRIGLVCLHFKEDGALDETPALIFECRDEATEVFFYEVTLGTIAGALARAGYTIKREIEL